MFLIYFYVFLFYVYLLSGVTWYQAVRYSVFLFNIFTFGKKKIKWINQRYHMWDACSAHRTSPQKLPIAAFLVYHVRTGSGPTAYAFFLIQKGKSPMSPSNPLHVSHSHPITSRRSNGPKQTILFQKYPTSRSPRCLNSNK